MAEPSILILDEAKSALDQVTKAGIIAQLPDMLDGRSAILIAHRLNSLSVCDSIVVLEHSEVIEDGTHDELPAAGGRYAELWTLQIGAQSRRGGHRNCHERRRAGGAKGERRHGHDYRPDPGRNRKRQ